MERYVQGTVTILSLVIFSATLAAAGIALVGMRRVELRQQPANERTGATGRSPERPVIILLVGAAFWLPIIIWWDRRANVAGLAVPAMILYCAAFRRAQPAENI